MKALLTCLSFVIASGCAQLAPFHGVPETTPPPVTKGVWAEIERIQAGDWMAPLNEGNGALEWRLRAIDSATSSIDLQSFLWTFDSVGSVVRERLLAAAERGVNVRILIDDSFLIGEDHKLVELNNHENVQYRVYNPYQRRTTGTTSRFALNLGEFSRLDHRMHNKSMVVDNQVAIIGGRNLADEYFGFDKDANFRDMELLLGGPVVEEISTEFDRYWNDQWSFPIEKISHVQVADTILQQPAISGADPTKKFPRQSQKERDAAWRSAVTRAHNGKVRLVVDDPPETRPEALSDRPIKVAEEINLLIGSARDEITIVSAYLIPTPELVVALRQAVERGVRVRLLTNSINSNNHLAAHAAYRNHLHELLGLGAELHEVRVTADSRTRYILPPVFTKHLGLHAKYMILDRKRVVVGSANLDPRSLRINTEMVVIVESRTLARELLRLTEPDFHLANAWRLTVAEDGKVYWVGDDITLGDDPSRNSFQRLEDWFFAHLPIEGEM